MGSCWEKKTIISVSEYKKGKVGAKEEGGGKTSVKKAKKIIHEKNDPSWNWLVIVNGSFGRILISENCSI